MCKYTVHESGTERARVWGGGENNCSSKLTNVPISDTNTRLVHSPTNEKN